MRRVISVLTVFVFIAVASCVWANPILYFTFDSADGDVVPDMSGGGHDGVLKEGAEIVSDARTGVGALEIEGENETMEVESFAELDSYSDNTYAFWISFTAEVSGGWDQIIVHPAPDSDRSPGLWVTPEGLSIHYRYNPDNLGFWGITQTGDQDANFFQIGEWYHIVGVTAAGTLVAYVNGAEVASIAVPEVFAQGTRDDMAGLYVGKSQSYSGPAARFIMDDLVIYDRALSADEAMELMTGLTAVDASDKLTSTWGQVKYSE